MNAAFLYHAINGRARAWGSSTPASSRFMTRSPRRLLERVEDVLLNRRPDAADRLTEFAETVKQKGKKAEWQADLARGVRGRSRTGSSTP